MWDNSNFLVSAEVVASALNIHVSRVHQLGRAGILPQPKTKGQWDLIACCSAYISNRLKESEEEQRDYEVEKTRLTKAQADKEELLVAEKKRLLVNADEVATSWARLVMAARSRFLSIPSKLAHELSTESNPNQVQHILTSAIYEALQELGEQKDE